MKYLKVKPQYDNVLVDSKHFLIGNELYTEREVARMHIPERCVIPVQVSKRETYWFFGARFSVK